MSKDAPATIWVPRSYVEKGVPRGGELLRKGYEEAKKEVTGSAATSQGIDKSPQARIPAPVVKTNIIALEIGRNGFLQSLKEKLKNVSVEILVDSEQVLDQSGTTQAERLILSRRLFQDFGSNLVVFIVAPDQIAPGEKLVFEIYDGMGGGILREISSIIPAYDAVDPSARGKAIASVLASVTEKVKDVAALVPWYGRVIAVDGEKVYINAGKEAGVDIGQQMKIYRDGKFVTSLGYAPGEVVGRLEIKGFIGPNGAYGTVTDGLEVRITDVVGLE